MLSDQLVSVTPIQVRQLAEGLTSSIRLNLYNLNFSLHACLINNAFNDKS